MRSTLTFAILLQSVCLLSQSTIYVNKNALTGLQNGTSWAHGFLDLQQALSIANYGDTIWVVKGTYFPTNTTNRDVSFVLKNGVKIYGGFLGTEVELVERDIELHQTILSGNIGGPEGGDNTYHVLYGTALDSNTIVDGFTIAKGMATGDVPPSSNGWGGGLLLEPSSDMYNTSPIIQNCRFEGNYALIGGAIHCPWEFGNYVNPIIRNCMFVSNRAEQSGGGFYKSGPAVPNIPFVLDNCTFSKNSVFYGNGGALFLTHLEHTNIIKNCHFEKDSSRFAWGGSVFCDRMKQSRLLLVSSNFNENYAVEGAGIYTEYEFASNDSFLIEALNCNFENNKASNGFGGAIVLDGATESRIVAKFQNCKFLNNRSASYGTALLISGKEQTLNVDQCVFSNNIGIPANPNGSRYAVYMGGLFTKSNFTNCLFSNNESALGFFSPANAEATHRITNCTFFQNGKYVIDKTNFPFNPGFNNCYITNSIFHDDATFDRMFSDNSVNSASMNGYYIDYSFVSLDDNVTPPGAFGPNTVFKALPSFVDTLNNDFRLLKCSPAVNAGNNQIVDSLNILTDLDGLPRIRFSTVDIGAYETQDSCIIIGSTEPHEASIVATLSPNPVSPGGTVAVQTIGLENSEVDWRLHDAQGRAVTSGTTLLSEGNTLTLEAPKTSGVFFLELRAGAKSIWLKMVVQ